MEKEKSRKNRVVFLGVALFSLLVLIFFFFGNKQEKTEEKEEKEFQPDPWNEKISDFVAERVEIEEKTNPAAPFEEEEKEEELEMDPEAPRTQSRRRRLTNRLAS